jgi:hypothetical protein
VVCEYTRFVDASLDDMANHDDARAAQRTYLFWLVGAVLVAGVLGFVAGSHRNGAALMTGTANVGDHVASIKSGDQFYGVRDSVAWFDSSGSFHEDGWPACLGQAGGQVNVRFGGLPVAAPESGLTFFDVAYIDCRGI